MNTPDSESGINRRDFLHLALSAGLVVGFGGMLKLAGREAAFVRPPGALAQADFLALCVKCQKCIDACPTQAVQSVTILEDLANAGTPQMNFIRGICDFCLECTVVCPTGAIQPVKKETAKLGTAVVRPEVCVAYTWVGCTKCYHSCTYEAIRLDDVNRPVIDPAKCNGCGVCENVCPSTSLRSSRLLSSKQKGIVVEPIARE